MDGLSMDEARAIGRMAAESVSKAATRHPFSRDLMKVTAVSGSNLTVSMGSALTVTGVPMTTACSGVRVGDVVVVDTYMHQPLVVGIIAR